MAFIDSVTQALATSNTMVTVRRYEVFNSIENPSGQEGKTLLTSPAAYVSAFEKRQADDGK